MKATEQIGNIQIFLPNENSKQFYIFQDLAKLLGSEYQSDAVSKLNKSLKELNLKPKPNIDYEADNTSIRTSSPKTIFEVVKVINKLTTLDENLEITKSEWDGLKNKLDNWQRPKPQSWKVGDIFSFQVQDKDYCFGQVVGEYPTCALLNLKSSNSTITETEINKSDVITILHLTPNNLNDFTWKIIDSNVKLVCSKDEGPWGSDKIRIGHKSGTPKYLENVARYHWFNEHDWKDENRLKELIIKKKGLLGRLFGK